MTADALGAGTGRRWTADELHALPVGTYVGYGRGIVARKVDTGWLVFEDDRPGLRVPALEPARVEGIVRGVDYGEREVAYQPGDARPYDVRGCRPGCRVHDHAAELDAAVGPTVDHLVRGRQFGKAAEHTAAVATAIDELAATALQRGCGLLLVRGSGALTAYVDARIPAGQLVEHPGPLPAGGVEALLASLYPPAGPTAGGHVAGCFLRGPIRHCVEGCTWVDDGRERMEGDDG